MNIKSIKVSDLIPAPYNPRNISDEALAGLKKSIQRWGIVEPIILNERSGHVVGGHHPSEAARLPAPEVKPAAALVPSDADPFEY